MNGGVNLPLIGLDVPAGVLDGLRQLGLCLLRASAEHLQASAERHDGATAGHETLTPRVLLFAVVEVLQRVLDVADGFSEWATDVVRQLGEGAEHLVPSTLGLVRDVLKRPPGPLVLPEDEEA